MLNDWNIVDHHILETEHDETQSRPDPSRRKQPTNKTQGQREKESKQQVEKQLDCTSQLDLGQRSGSLTHVNIQPSILIKLVGWLAALTSAAAAAAATGGWELVSLRLCRTLSAASKLGTEIMLAVSKLLSLLLLILSATDRKHCQKKKNAHSPCQKEKKIEKEEQPFNVTQSRTSFLYSVCVFVLSFLTVQIA